MTQQIKLVKMEERHIKEMAGIERLCFSDPWSYDALYEELENPTAAFFVAELEGRCVGYAGMYSVVDEGYINNVAVHPGCRRQGVASLLMEKLQDYAREKHLSFLTLEVRASNSPAILLYEKFGFQRAGIRKGYYREPREDAVLMTRFFKIQDINNTETEVPN